MLKIPVGNKVRALTVVKDAMRNETARHETKMEEFDKWDEQYLNKSVSSNLDDSPKASINSADTYKNCRIMQASLSQSLVNPNLFSIESNDDKDAKMRAEKINALVKAQLREMDFVSKGIRMTEIPTKYGTIAVRVYWKRTAKEVTRKEVTSVFGLDGKPMRDSDDNEIKKSEYVTKEILTYDDPFIEVCDLKNTYFIGNGTNAEDLDAVITEKYITRPELEENEAREITIDGEPIEVGVYDLDNVKWDTDYTEEKQTIDDEKESRSVNKYKLWEFEGWFSLKSKKNNDGNVIEEEGLKLCLITVLNENKVIRCQETPFHHGCKSYIAHQLIPNEFEIYGYGIPQLGEQYQAEINDTENQMLDNRSRILNSERAVDSTSLEYPDGRDLKSRQNGTIRMAPGADVNKAIKWHMPPDISGTALQSNTLLKNEYMSIAGANVSKQGQVAKSGTTASEINQMNTFSDQMLWLVKVPYEREFIAKIVERVQLLDEQYLRRKRAIQYIGKEGMLIDTNISPDDIYGNFNVVIKGTVDMQANMVKSQQMTQMAQVYAPLGILDMSVMFKKQYEYMGFTDADDVLIKKLDVDAESVPPEYENEALAQNTDIEVVPADPDGHHIQVHRQILVPTEASRRHLIAHQKQLQMKTIVAAQRQQAMGGVSPQGQFQQGQQVASATEGSTAPQVAPAQVQSPQNMGAKI